jgi:alkylation response protein AidB-like acyl-CoA dehydrogenase
MDFTITDEQQAAIDLAAQILADQTEPQRIKAVERSASRIDHELWAELAKADLLGLSLPEAHGGGGYGFLEICLILQQIGRFVAPVPYWATVVLGGLPIAHFGTDEQQAAHLPGVVAGSTFLTAALNEPGTGPRTPFTRAVADGDGWRLTGTKLVVPAAADAAVVLVPARTDDGRVGVFLVAPSADGVTCEAEDTTAHWPSHHVTLDGVRVTAADALGGSIDDGQAQLDWIVDRATVGLTAISAGVCDEAVKRTAAYATERHQFGRPIATFQAVGQRAANAYIDARAIRLTTLNAASLLDAGLVADKEVATAKFWAGEGASRVVHAALHIHAGVSIDIDYPIHRYFQWSKQIENDLGSAIPQLERLGAIIAAEPARAS